MYTELHRPSEPEQAVVLADLRSLVADIELQPGDKRLPNERSLAERLGVTRAKLRKGLSVLESEGRLWRGVGQGTV